MIHMQNSKFVSVLDGGAILDNTSPTTKVIDCAGFDHCRIYVQLGALDIAMTALKVQESDVAASASALTGGTDVPGLVYGTSTNIAGATSALPVATDDNKTFAFDIDLRARKRYLDVLATVGDGAAGTYCTIFAILSRAEIAPVTAAQQGLADVLMA